MNQLKSMQNKIYFIGNNIFEYEGIENSTLSDAFSYLERQDIIALDIETTRKYQRNKYASDIYKAGLDPHLSEICMIQIGTLEKQFVIDVRAFGYKILKPYFQSILENEKILKILHNAKFEGKFFLNKMNISIINLWDTMLCERILYNGYIHSYSLAALMNRYLGVKAKDSIDLFNIKLFNQAEEDIDMYVDKSTRMQFINWGSKPFTLKQIKYGAEDIVSPLKIYKVQVKGRKVNGILWNPKRAFRLENKFTQILANVELQGMPFNKAMWLDVYAKNIPLYQERLTLLNSYVSSNYLMFTHSIDLFSNTPTCAIEWSSSKQVIKFFRHLGICPKEKSKQTKKMEWTVGAASVFKLLENENKLKFYTEKYPISIDNTQDFILAYLLFKKTEQLVTTFGKDFLKYVHPITGKLHTSYNQFMNTGRLSSTSPNLQNIPGKEEFRACFSNGERYVNADFSGQESVCLASISQVPALVDFYKNGHEIFGTDLHSYAATNMYRALLGDKDLVITKKSDKEKRNNAKAFNFKLAYGGSAWTIKDEIGKTIEETEELLSAYFEGFPGLLDDFKKAKQTAVKQGWIQLCPYTDKRYFYPFKEEMDSVYKEIYSLTKIPPMTKIPEEEKVRLREETDWNKLWKKYGGLKGKLERRGLNYRIQGAAATQAKLAGLIFYKNRKDKSQHIMNFIHDEILATSAPKLIEDTAILTEESMVKGGTLVLNGLSIKAGAKISTIWEH